MSLELVLTVSQGRRFPKLPLQRRIVVQGAVGGDELSTHVRGASGMGCCGGGKRQHQRIITLRRSLWRASAPGWGEHERGGGSASGAELARPTPHLPAQPHALCMAAPAPFF